MPALVSVPLPGRAYDIHIGLAADELANALARTLDDRATSLHVLYDAAVQSHLPAVEAAAAPLGLPLTTAAVASGEPSKSLAEFGRQLQALAETRADRRGVVLALGGGVVGDLAGFVAASYLRGVDFVQLPTTLLAAVDSSVGGKTGINLPTGKNLVGAFHQPRGVLMSPAFFTTLPQREWVSGLAEVLKYGVIMDEPFFASLERDADRLLARDEAAVTRIIERSCQCKAEVVLADERETSGRRAILNYGHTFGHAYETLLGYGRLLHGEAIAVGMRHASRMAESLGLLDPSATARQRALIERFGLPTALPESLDPDDVLAAMMSDKKTEGGRLRLILPDRLGHVALHDDVSVAAVREVLAEVLAETRPWPG